MHTHGNPKFTPEREREDWGVRCLSVGPWREKYG